MRRIIATIRTRRDSVLEAADRLPGVWGRVVRDLISIGSVVGALVLLMLAVGAFIYSLWVVQSCANSWMGHLGYECTLDPRGGSDSDYYYEDENCRVDKFGVETC